MDVRNFYSEIFWRRDLYPARARGVPRTFGDYLVPRDTTRYIARPRSTY